LQLFDKAVELPTFLLRLGELPEALLRGSNLLGSLHKNIDGH
jgi:hypothetical protein